MCTGTTIRPQENPVIFARTFEFATEVHFNTIINPNRKKIPWNNITK